MKKLLFLLLLSIFATIDARSQEQISLEERVDSISLVRVQLKNEIDSLSRELNLKLSQLEKIDRKRSPKDSTKSVPTRVSHYPKPNIRTRLAHGID